MKLLCFIITIKKYMISQTKMSIITDYKKFLSENPFEDYDFFDRSLLFNFRQSAEFGLGNHSKCRKVYENLYNDEIVAQSFSTIKIIGGPQALNANLDTLNEYSKLSQCTGSVKDRWLFVYSSYYTK